MRKTHSSFRLVIAFLLVTGCILFAACSCAPETDNTPINPEIVVESVPTMSDTTATSTTTETAVDEVTTEALSTTSESTSDGKTKLSEGTTGEEAFADMSRALDSVSLGNICTVAYPISRTLSAYGEVTRGICYTDSQGRLEEVKETYRVRRCEDGIIRSFAESDEGVVIAEDAVASMNFFGLSPHFARLCKDEFAQFLATLAEDEMRAELPLSVVIDRLVQSGRIEMRVIVTDSKWMGVTFREDKENVQKALASMHGN